MEKVQITVIGAGVVGLAVAASISKAGQEVFVVELESFFGQGTSSRNSEVIHAGIYYPKDSLKTKMCIEGREMLYDFCEKQHVAHKRIGKLIVAIDDSEIEDLENLYKKGLENGVSDLTMLFQSELKRIEPHVEARLAILSPSTGIMDSHNFMKSLVSQIKSQAGQIVYQTEVVGIGAVKGGYEVRVNDKAEGEFKFFSRILINCAGLNSDKIAAMPGLKKDEYRLKYCKGDYFRVNQSKAHLINQLVYPVPKKDRAGLGTHATLDLAGGMRLGPDDEYIDKITYDVDAAKGKIFYESVKSFLPFIREEDLSPDTAGIRPKLQGPGEDFRDFIIKDEVNSGFPGLINLIGIESPGLTASLSIAKMVKEIASNYI